MKCLFEIVDRGANLGITVDIPITPVVGMTLRVTPDGDFFEVWKIIWDCESPDELYILVNPVLSRFSADDVDWLINQGWSFT